MLHWPPSSFSRMPGMLLSQGLALALSFAWMTFLSDIIKFPSLTSLKLLLQCHFLSDGFSGYQASNYHYTTPHLLCLFFIIYFSLTFYGAFLFFNLNYQSFVLPECKLSEGRDFCPFYSSLYP